MRDRWAPLTALLGACDGVHHGPTCDFMYMGDAAGPFGRVNLYKHSVTRRYLGIDGGGNTYVYERGRFGIELRRTELPAAITTVLADEQRQPQ